mmetsp:Transcript_5090/g.6747  ORF Transcript_5090/g.6747 Transcript_5090/m.6747 type:complete len:148 (+) Transcript_5090:2628-3071(+)
MLLVHISSFLYTTTIPVSARHHPDMASLQTIATLRKGGYGIRINPNCDVRQQANTMFCSHLNNIWSIGMLFESTPGGKEKNTESKVSLFYVRTEVSLGMRVCGSFPASFLLIYENFRAVHNQVQLFVASHFKLGSIRFSTFGVLCIH